MFTNLFANLENISLTNSKHPNKKLGQLARSSDFLLFYVLSSSTPPNPTFLQNFQQFLLACNTANNNQNQSTMATPKKKNNFNATTSPAKLKRLFGLGKKPTAAGAAEENANGLMAKGQMNFIVLDVEFSPNYANLAFLDDLEQLYFIRPQSYLAKSRLLRALGFVNAPSLFVVDCADKFKIISQIYREIMDDPNGNQFPWKNPLPSELFKREFLTKSPNGSLVKLDGNKLGNGVKGIFFGAKWCPPSRQMCKQLCEIYPKIKENWPQFQIIFCSYDRSEDYFCEHFASMPWLALPYGQEKQLAKAYDVQGIPTFLIIDEHFSLITRNGLNLLLSDPSGYPWNRKPLYELTELTAHRLSEMPSIILFTEGSPEDTEFSIQFLGACAELIPQVVGIGNGNDVGPSCSSKTNHQSANFMDQLQIFYTGEDPICDYILENLGQEQADLPLLLICDVMAGHLAICDKPDVSEQVLLEFVDTYLAGHAKVESIPGQRQRQSRIVAGIPSDVLQQLVIHQLPYSGFTRSA